MLVTSATEVVYPCIFDFLHVGLNKGLSVSDLAGCEARGCRQVNHWGQPELGLSNLEVSVGFDSLVVMHHDEPCVFTVVMPQCLMQTHATAIRVPR